ncbi:MAG TPA: hypothetical protein VGS08_05615 [Candidatus Saccharimonadales bacterium]|nr:hypothetical protein [Candidatus Saccharimonadales bacterium]
MIILVDMDNTLVDFDAGLLKIWRQLYPDEFFVPLERRTAFHPHNDYPKYLQSTIQDICHSEGFIRNLPPTPGGIEAVNEMLDRGHDVRFCTSHLFKYDHCLLEKYQWIEKYFDVSYVDRIILTRDKTLIRGDILIDDKPEIVGIEKPTWEHILYDRPFNRGVTDKRRLNWKNWHDILDLNAVT